MAVIPPCSSCTDLESTCIHRKQYDDVHVHIKTLHPEIDIIDKSAELPDDDYKGGTTRDYKVIWMWLSACRRYGWPMLTSILIHEFGHVLLFDAEQLWNGEEAERKTNRYGFCQMPHHLVPELYWFYRDFFLGSYIGEIWDKAKTESEYEKWVKWMRSKPAMI